jgi:hypothetical protein
MIQHDPTALLLSYIRTYGNISLITVDIEENKIVWYNKQLYHVTHKAILYVDKKYLLCLDNLKILNYSAGLSDKLLDFINDMGIFHGIISYATQDGSEYSTYAALISLSSSYKLLRIIPQNIKRYSKSGKTLSDLHKEFDEYLEKYYEKICYIIC